MTEEEVNQNMLRGAKSLSDKTDAGTILLPVRAMEKERVEQIIQQNPGLEMPTHCIHVYKNRRGEYSFVKVWCKGYLGTCRIKPLFATDNNFNIVNIPGSKITVKEMLKF